MSTIGKCILIILVGKKMMSKLNNVKNMFFSLAFSRVSKEENVGRRTMSYSSDNDDNNPDAHLPVTESFLYDILRKIANNDERLMYIYVFTAIVLATVIITLFRSFLFFAVSHTKS